MQLTISEKRFPLRECVGRPISLEDDESSRRDRRVRARLMVLWILHGQTVREFIIDWQRHGTTNDRASLGSWNSMTWEAATLGNCGSPISPNR